MLSDGRVTLRAPDETDLDMLVELVNDLGSWEERNPEPARLRDRDAVAERFRARRADPGDEIEFVIVADSLAVGRCTIFHVDRFARHAEVGIALVGGARGNGWGTAALHLLVGFAFERWNLRRVHLCTLAGNAAAIASYRKVGFVEEGRRREHAWVRGRYDDEVLMGLLRSEWRG